METKQTKKEIEAEVIFAGSNCPPTKEAAFPNPHMFEEISDKVYFCRSCGMVIKMKHNKVKVNVD